MAAKAKTTTATKMAAKKPAAAKRPAAKKTVKSAAKQPGFFEAKFTEQSVYWLIFGAVAILFAIWIYQLDSKVRDLYDQVDANNSALQTTPIIKEKKD